MKVRDYKKGRVAIMTLLLALKWMLEDEGRIKEAVVVASDSKVTTEFVSYEERKIYPIGIRTKNDEVPLAVAGGAGDVPLIKQSYKIFEKILTSLAIKKWEGKTPSFEQFELAVGEIESALISRFRELREQGIDPNINMILASVDSSGRASIYRFDGRGLAEPVHDNPGFAVIGKGFVTGGNLLLKLLGYTPSYTGDLGMLSTFIIDVVSEIDPTVGSFLGENYLMRVEEGKVVLGPLKEEFIKEYKEKVRRRKDIIKRIWELMDEFGEEKVERKIEELEATSQK
jgi:hypothetical protein